jgi:hypothetical protein
VVHAIWCFVLGDNPTLWYVARISCFWIAASAFWYALSGRIGHILAGLVTFRLAAQPFWVDIVPRSGSEMFAAAGSAVLLAGISLLLEPGRLTWRLPLSARRTIAASSCVLAGGLTAIGSKENFTVLIFGAVACLLVLSTLAKHPRLLIHAYAVVLMWGAVILYFIYKGELSRGVDLYNVSISQRMSLISRSLLEFNIPLVLLVLYVGSAILAFVVQRQSGKRLFTNVTPLLVVAVIQLYLVLARAFLYVFYNGAVVKTDRYAFPYAIIPMLSLVLLLVLLRELDVAGVWAEGARKNIGWVAACGLVALLLGTGVPAGRAEAARYTEATLAFKAGLERTAAALRPDPTKPLLFRSFAPSDMESLASVAEYLRVAGIRNQFYLSIVGYDRAPDKPPTVQMLLGLTMGMVGPGRTFLLESELPPGRDPTVIVFSAPEQRPPALASFNASF